MKSIAAIYLSSLLLTACQPQMRGKDELASAYGNKLYLADIETALSSASNSLDSAQIIDKAVDNWIMSEILYNEAKKEVSKDENIAALVESYKKSLYIHELEKKKLQALDTTNISNELLQVATDSTTQRLLEEPCMRFLLVKVNEAAYDEQLQSSWKTEDLPALDVFVQRANGLGLLDIDRWYYETEFNSITPIELRKKINYSKTDSYSLTQGGHQLLLKVLEYRKAGEAVPDVLALPRIKQRILHDKSIVFLKEWKKTLYQNNIQSKNIHINNN